jgi:hypothetical protein
LSIYQHPPVAYCDVLALRRLLFLRNKKASTSIAWMSVEAISSW